MLQHGARLSSMWVSESYLKILSLSNSSQRLLEAAAFQPSNANQTMSFMW
jgi:hypothetical protein